MGKKSKLKAQPREQQEIVEHTPDWTQHTQEMFAAYVDDCAAKGAESLRLLLTDRQNFRHLRSITQGRRYPIPVYIQFIGDDPTQSPLSR